jgi:hypothetical protein
VPDRKSAEPGLVPGKGALQPNGQIVWIGSSIEGSLPQPTPEQVGIGILVGAAVGIGFLVFPEVTIPALGLAAAA